VSEAEAMFDACIRYAQAISEMHTKAREAKRQRRNERRRMIYEIRKKCGIPNRKPKPEPIPEKGYEAPTGCECHFPGACVPCRWCESRGECEKCGEIVAADELMEVDEKWICEECKDELQPPKDDQ
jgi:hypothetical protein